MLLECEQIKYGILWYLPLQQSEIDYLNMLFLREKWGSVLPGSRGFDVPDMYLDTVCVVLYELATLPPGTKPGGMGGSAPQLKNFARPCPPTKYMLFVQKEDSKNLT